VRRFACYGPRMSAPTLRPLQVGEILDASVKVYLKNARVLIGLAALVVVPVQILSSTILLNTVSSGSEVPGSFPRLGSFGSAGSVRPIHPAASIGSTFVVGILGWLANLLVTAACVKAVSDTYLDQPTSTGASLRFAVRRLGSLVWMDILLGLGLVLAFVALIVPGIWLYAAWAVATPALLIEGKRGPSALGRSRRLVRGRWWPTAGVLLVSTLLVTVVGGAFSGVLLAFLLSGGHSAVTRVIVSSLGSGAAAILTRPFQAVVVTILYYDLRVRHEGYDVELLAEQLGIEPAKLPPPDTVPGSGTYVGTGPEAVGQPGGPPFWPPPPGWKPARADGEQR
jgi:hypothetical protein